MGLKIVSLFSGGVTSAWATGWALRTYPRKDVILLFHDTKEEHKDTYRFLREMSEALGMPITERSDGRSVTDLCYDEGAIPNQRMAFCSRILKAEPGERFIRELQADGHDVLKVVGFSAREWQRVQRVSMRADRGGYRVCFPCIENKMSKQQCADWCLSLGVRPSAMYLWSDHANCVGCVRGGKNYWLAVDQNATDVFEQRMNLENEFGHSILKIPLSQLRRDGVKRAAPRREAIEIGPCECGD